RAEAPDEPWRRHALVELQGVDNGRRRPSSVDPGAELGQETDFHTGVVAHQYATGECVENTLERLPGVEPRGHRVIGDAVQYRTLPHAAPVVAGRPEQQRSGAAQHDPLAVDRDRSEEHTSELQSRFDLVCR